MHRGEAGDVLAGPAEFERMVAPNAPLARAEEAARRGEDGWQQDALFKGLLLLPLVPPG